MIISLDKIVTDYELDIRGVLHIGAHYGEEYPVYIKQGVKNMIFFEPVKSNYKKLLETLPKRKKNIQTFNYALGSKRAISKMYIETVNKGQSCSLLAPKEHLKQYPQITFDSKESVAVERLDNVEFDRSLYNMINIDVQGYELEVFKGAKETLRHIDIVYTEINLKELYKDCCQVEDLDNFLKEFGFIRILTEAPYNGWGDALYLKYK